MRLLRLTNGAQINGAFFKEAENLVLENLDVPRAHVIVLGNAGNVDEYLFDTRDRHFHVSRSASRTSGRPPSGLRGAVCESSGTRSRSSRAHGVRPPPGSCRFGLKHP